MFTREDMSKVGAAVDTLNFRSPAIRIRHSLYCAGNFVVKAWPPAIRFKLVFRTVQFGAATFADVGAFFPESVVFAGEGHFGAFVNDNLFFFRGKLFEIGLFFRS